LKFRKSGSRQIVRVENALAEVGRFLA